MKQYSFEDVRQMSFEQLAAIDDPMQLSATGFISPMLVRYVVRTGQLDARYGGRSLSTLLEAIDSATVNIVLPAIVGQKIPLAVRDSAVDSYLDDLQSHVEHAHNTD